MRKNQSKIVCIKLVHLPYLPEIVIRFEGKGRYISPLRSDQVWNPSSLLSNGYQMFFQPEKKPIGGVKLNIHLRLIPRLRMSGFIPPHPNMKCLAQGLMCLYFTLFCFGQGILCSCHALRLPFLFKLLFEKYFVEIPHLRVSFMGVIKFEAVLLILVIIRGLEV